MKVNSKLMTLVLIFGLLLSGCDKIDQFFGRNSNSSFDSGTQNQNTERVQMLLPNFTELVNRTGASVVNVQGRVENKVNRIGNLSEQDPFYEFFRRMLPDAPEIQSDEDNMNYGSGFIISSDGYIITNVHVVKGTTSVKVSTTEKREYKAKIIGMDETSDIALLKIDAKNLPVVQIGDPKALQVGEWVAAIGAPFGFDNSVTSGIISALKRSLPGDYTPFIQTDVAINPGNSGGPLFNLNGQVIGVNSQIYSRSGGFMGISFAIPIDIAMNVAEQLKTNGTVKRGQLGVVIQEVSYDLAKSFGLDKIKGSLVVRVIKNGPADKAKIAVGDIILKVNGEEIDSSNDLPLSISSLSPGETVKLLIWRNKKEIEIEVTLAELKQTPIHSNQEYQQDAPQQNIDKFESTKLGLYLSPLSVELSKKYGVDQGLLVLRANKNAGLMGFVHGDVIVSIGTQPVYDEDSLKNAINAHEEVLPVYLMRNGQMLFLPIQLG